MKTLKLAFRPDGYIQLDWLEKELQRNKVKDYLVNGNIITIKCERYEVEDGRIWIYFKGNKYLYSRTTYIADYKEGK